MFQPVCDRPKHQMWTHYRSIENLLTNKWKILQIKATWYCCVILSRVPPRQINYIKYCGFPPKISTNNQNSSQFKSSPKSFLAFFFLLMGIILSLSRSLKQINKTALEKSQIIVTFDIAIKFFISYAENKTINLQVIQAVRLGSRVRGWRRIQLQQKKIIKQKILFITFDFIIAKYRLSFY